jgi:hypothetical protein
MQSWRTLLHVKSPASLPARGENDHEEAAFGPPRVAPLIVLSFLACATLAVGFAALNPSYGQFR